MLATAWNLSQAFTERSQCDGALLADDVRTMFQILKQQSTTVVFRDLFKKNKKMLSSTASVQLLCLYIKDSLALQNWEIGKVAVNIVDKNPEDCAHTGITVYKYTYVY
jgi:hypothetical protein